MQRKNQTPIITNKFNLILQSFIYFDIKFTNYKLKYSFFLILLQYIVNYKKFFKIIMKFMLEELFLAK